MCTQHGNNSAAIDQILSLIQVNPWAVECPRCKSNCGARKGGPGPHRERVAAAKAALRAALEAL